MINAPYYFVPGYGGTIGYLDSKNSNLLCGLLSHFDEKGELFWWNGGLKKFKHDNTSEFINFTHYSFFNRDSRTEGWIKGSNNQIAFECSLSENDEIKSLSHYERNVISSMNTLYFKLFDKEVKILE